MRIRSILVHLAYDRDHSARVQVAHDLARQHGAHLKALYIDTPIGTPHGIAGRGASFRFLTEMEDAAREHAAQVRAEMDEQCRADNLPFEWMTDQGPHLALLARQTRCVDLAIVSRVPPQNMEQRLKHELPHHLPLVASCPTLILPHDYEPPSSLGRRILVAWKYSRESSRALRTALPFLTDAQAVRVATVLDHAPVEDPLDEVVLHLNRHGVQTEHESMSRGGEGGGGSASGRLLDRADDWGADMMVMGAYGHSRMRDLILGSATEHILHHAHVPVLMDH